jgi:electron transfer flavoprotein beta subunit
MKLICLVKFVPDVEDFKYDVQRNILIRENVKMILNPDDACALAFALKVKDKDPDTFIEIVSMAPTSVITHLEDLLRRNVDQATLISDRMFAGSDTYVTSRILSRYLEGKTFDCILSGTHSLDGDTSHVPSQVGEALHIQQISNIVKIDENLFKTGWPVIDVDSENLISTYRVGLPAILSLSKESKYKLPFVKFKNIDLDVHSRIQIVTNQALGFQADEVGLEGSLTQVARTFTKNLSKKDRIFVKTDIAGIDTVYAFLKAKGFI